MLIKTKSFSLAIHARGDINSPKLAFVLPGRLDTKDYVSMKSHVDFLSTLGFYAVSFDAPGTWESKGDISLFSTTNYIKATNELIDYFNKPSILIGHSRGGAVSIIAGAQNEKVTAIVSIMANFADPTKPSEEAVSTGIYKSYRDFPPGSKKTKAQKEFLMSINYFKDGKKYNAGNTLKTCYKPKLIFYGTNDSFTSVSVAEKIFNQTPEPKMRHKLETEHDYRYHQKIINEINKTLEIFINKYDI